MTDFIRYSKENLKIYTGVPSPPFLPSLTLPSSSSPLAAFPSLSPSPPFLYPLPLEVGPLKSS